MLLSYNGSANFTYDAIGNLLSYNNGSAYTFSWSNGRQLTSGSTENAFDTVESYAGAIAQSSAECAQQMAPVVTFCLLGVICLGAACCFVLA